MHKGRKKAKFLKAFERGSTRLAQYSILDRHHSFMITWLVTWFDDKTSCKRSHWLHDSHVVCRHNVILVPICRAANIIHTHFPTLRKVAHNQNLSLLLSSLCQNKFWPQKSKSQFQRLRKVSSPQQNYSKSWFRKDVVKNQQPAPPAATSIHLSTNDPAETSSIPAAASNQPPTKSSE